MAAYCIPRKRRHHRTNPAKREGCEGSLINKGEGLGESPRGKGVTHGVCRRVRNRGSSDRHPGGDGPCGTPGGGKQERIVGASTVRGRGAPRPPPRPVYPMRSCWTSSGQATIPPNALGADNTCPGSSTTTTNRRVWRNARGTGKYAGSAGRATPRSSRPPELPRGGGYSRNNSTL